MVPVIQGVALLVQLLTSASDLMAKGTQIGSMITNAGAQNRTTFTDEEWAQITGLDDAARANLQKGIDAAKVSAAQNPEVTKPVG